jgi:hypothetical protein
MKIKCPKCKAKIEINPAAMLGSISTEKKAEAARKNASAPPRPGSKPRGWPKGKPRKVAG